MSLSLTLTFDGHRVRMIGTPERPEWIARDVCRALLIHHTADALRNAGIAADERGSTRIDTPGGPQDVTTVTEPGLWKLVMASRKPAALRFKQWLATDVLPCIRKHGCYPAPAQPRIPASFDVRDPRQLAPLAIQLIQYVQELEPKAAAHDRLSAANGDVSLMDAGRILGRQPLKLCRQMEADGLLFRGSHGVLEPYAEHRNRGYFRVRITEVDGQAFVQTLVTPAGVQWLASRYPQVPGGDLAVSH